MVDGQTITNWLSEEPRTWQDIIGIFEQAGEGLAAAHDAGLVHRDFKPDNVLVGRDGRVRVMDFGLAREVSGESDFDPTPSLPADREIPLVEDPVLSTPLTRAGSVLGTPVYMSPEQHRGETADARSDQFSFCVALYEGLCGTRPFVGSSIAEILNTIEGGHLEKPAQGRHVPHWVLAPIHRGVASWLPAGLESVRHQGIDSRKRNSGVGMGRSFSSPATGSSTVWNP
jgi:serine/threonine protein kinase